jgi:hypothetical protein
MIDEFCISRLSINLTKCRKKSRGASENFAMHGEPRHFGEIFFKPSTVLENEKDASSMTS